MLMYLIMFFAAIKLRFSEPEHHRAFKIPGGLAGMLLVAGIGIVGVLTTFGVSFIPPQDINVGSFLRYELTLIFGLIVMCAPPFVSSWLQSKNKDAGMELA
jgi:amino acid transporter